MIKHFNSIDPNALGDNYFSDVYGDKYYSMNNAKKIGFIRDFIANENLKERERFILITSLMYAADKCANTVGHFEHYLSSFHNDKNLIMNNLNINESDFKNHKELLFVCEAS